MRYNFFLHYGWFFQNLGKEAVRTFMHTTVHAMGLHVFKLITWYYYVLENYLKLCQVDVMSKLVSQQTALCALALVLNSFRGLTGSVHDLKCGYKRHRQQQPCFFFRLLSKLSGYSSQKLWDVNKTNNLGCFANIFFFTISFQYSWFKKLSY